MIFNPLFIDLEAKQLNTLGQSSSKGSYLFRDIINLESSEVENRKFDASNVLSNLLTEINYLSKSFDDSNSDLNGLLAGFRIAGNSLAAHKNSVNPFNGDAPILIESSEELKNILSKSLTGLTSEYDLEILSDSGINLEGDYSESSGISEEELLVRLQNILKENGQLNLHIFNADSKETFNLTVQQVANSENETTSTETAEPSYLLSVSAKNFSYRDKQTPFIQKIIEANRLNSPEFRDTKEQTNTESLPEAKSVLTGKVVDKLISSADTQALGDKTQTKISTANVVSENKNQKAAQILIDKVVPVESEDGSETLVNFKKAGAASLTGKAEKTIDVLSSTAVTNHSEKENRINTNPLSSRTEASKGETIIQQSAQIAELKVLNSKKDAAAGKPIKAMDTATVNNSLKIQNDNPPIKDAVNETIAAKANNAVTKISLEPVSEQKNSEKMNRVLSGVNKIANEAIQSQSVNNESAIKSKSTVQIKLVAKAAESYDDINRNQTKGFVEDSSSLGKTKEIKYSPLFEEIAEVRAQISRDKIRDNSTVKLDDGAKNNSAVNSSEVKHALRSDEAVQGVSLKQSKTAEAKSGIESLRNEIGDNKSSAKLSSESYGDNSKQDREGKQSNSESQKSTVELLVKEPARAKNTQFDNVLNPEASKPETPNVKIQSAQKTESKINEVPAAQEEKHIQQSKKENVNPVPEEISKSKLSDKGNETQQTQNIFNTVKEPKQQQMPEQQFQTVKVNPKEQQQPQLNSKIVDEISDMVLSDKKDKAIINLEPASLGKIKIMVELIDNKLSARVDVDNQAAKELLQNQMQQLKESLSSSGIQLSSLNISQQNADQKGGRTDRERRRDESINNVKGKKEQAKDTRSKDYGYNTYEFIA